MNNRKKADFRLFSEQQMEVDRMIYLHIKREEEKGRIKFYHAIQDCFEFNTIVFSKIVPLIVRYECLVLIAKDRDKLKRKIKMSDLLEISEKFNRISIVKEVKSLDQIKKADYTPALST
jgi:hypothetical protein